MTKKRRLTIDTWMKDYFADSARTADYERSLNNRRIIVERDAGGRRIAVLRFPAGKDKKMNRLPRGQRSVSTARILCATHRKRRGKVPRINGAAA
jgi:hypothetical protein